MEKHRPQGPGPAPSPPLCLEQSPPGSRSSGKGAGREWWESSFQIRIQNLYPLLGWT